MRGIGRATPTNADALVREDRGHASVGGTSGTGGGLVPTALGSVVERSASGLGVSMVAYCRDKEVAKGGEDNNDNEGPLIDGGARDGLQVGVSDACMHPPLSPGDSSCRIAADDEEVYSKITIPLPPPGTTPGSDRISLKGCKGGRRRPGDNCGETWKRAAPRRGLYRSTSDLRGCGGGRQHHAGSDTVRLSSEPRPRSGLERSLAQSIRKERRGGTEDRSDRSSLPSQSPSSERYCSYAQPKAVGMTEGSDRSNSQLQSGEKPLPRKDDDTKGHLRTTRRHKSDHEDGGNLTSEEPPPTLGLKAMAVPWEKGRVIYLPCTIVDRRRPKEEQGSDSGSSRAGGGEWDYKVMFTSRRLVRRRRARQWVPGDRVVSLKSMRQRVMDEIRWEMQDTMGDTEGDKDSASVDLNQRSRAAIAARLQIDPNMVDAASRALVSSSVTSKVGENKEICDKATRQKKRKEWIDPACEDDLKAQSKVMNKRSRFSFIIDPIRVIF